MLSRSISMVVVLTVALAGVALAGDAPVTMGLGLGFAMPTGEFHDEVSFDLDAGLSVSGFVRRKIGGLVGWRVEGGIDEMSRGSDAAPVPPCGPGMICHVQPVLLPEARLSRLMAGLDLSADDAAEAVRPYGYATFGVVRWAGDTKTGYDTDTFFGLSLGGGVDWWAGKNWGLAGEVRMTMFGASATTTAYPNFTGDKQWLWYVTPTIYATYRPGQ